MDRAYLSIAAGSVPHESDSALFGELAKKLPFALEPTQTAAWEYQIQHLRQLAGELSDAHFFMEFLIPRMGRRADLISQRNACQGFRPSAFGKSRPKPHLTLNLPI